MAETMQYCAPATKQGRKKSVDTRESCQKLLEKSVAKFALGQVVKYQDVGDLYQDRNEYFRDCKRIKKKLNEVRDWIELLGVPVPLVEYGRGDFHIPVRNFVARINPDLLAERRQLAKALIDHKLNDGPLVPRSGITYFGFGTTVLTVAEYLCQHLHDFQEISMVTSNVEVLLRYYVIAPASLRNGHLLLQDGGKIDWDFGCVIPTEKKVSISTSIVSFEAMDKDGRFYADNEPKRDLVQDALSRSQRIILVGEKEKFTGGGARPEISLPDTGNRKIYLFTNGRPPRGYQCGPDGVKLKLIMPERPNVTIASGNVSRRTAK
jgi:hypothetical protein